MRTTICAAILVVMSSFAAAETLIPRSMEEKAKYYLVEQKGTSIITTIHVRKSAFSTGYSVTEINCSNRTYRDMGYGEDSRSNVKMYEPPGNWTRLIKGSSKSDLVTFVCG